MKKRIPLYILLVLACLVSVWLLLRLHGKPQGSNIFAISEPAAKQSNEPAIKKGTVFEQISSNAPLQTVFRNKPESNYVEKVQGLLEAKNVPIEFYGMVIDQNSNVLSGVKIKVAIRHWELSKNADSRIIRLEKETDINGRFELNGETGDGFDIASIGKKGYELEPNKSGFGPSAGNYENPIIFKMWNNDVKEPLVTGSKFFKVVSNGQNYTIDLVNGTVIDSTDPAGDLVVWIKRSEPKVDWKYDWSFNVQANYGGLSEEINQYDAMYVAPESGYTNSFSGESLATDQHWGDAIAGKRFFIKTRSGQIYGRIEIEVYPSYGHTGEGRFRIQYAINPSGSRILR